MDGRTEALGRILGRRTFRILAGGYLSGELKVGKKPAVYERSFAENSALLTDLLPTLRTVQLRSAV